MVVYYLFMGIIGAIKLPHWTILPGLFVVYLNINVWGFLAAMAAARFKDIRFLLPFIGQIIFYITPVFWNPGPMAAAHGIGGAFLKYNPFGALVEVARQPLLGQSASADQWIVALGLTVVGIVTLTASFVAFRRRIAFWI